MNQSKRTVMTGQDANAICIQLFGKQPDNFETPGGASRKTFIAVFGSARFVISRRSSSSRAALEADVLRSLYDTGLVPKLLRHEGDLIVQEYVAGRRLSEVLEQGVGQETKTLINGACASLVALQAAGQLASLDRRAPDIGERSGWVDDLMAVPDRLAADFAVSRPEFGKSAVRALLTPKRRSFIKWDARPGNGLVRPDGTICWFDWEHAGVRAGIDDLVWLLADEWCPEDRDSEMDALNNMTAASGMTIEEVSTRFFLMAVFHTCVRLSLILGRKQKTGWEHHETALKFDRLGVTRPHVARLCRRGGRWAAENEITAGFTSFFKQIGQKTLGEYQ